MRRKEKDMGLEFAHKVVDKCVYATLSMVDGNNTPYCLPLSIVRQDEFIYFHCAHEGKKIDILRQNPKVCISCVGDTSTPKGRFSVNFESAIVFGSAKELMEEAAKIEALRLLCQRHTPDNMQNFDKEIAKFIDVTLVWEIKIENIAAKH